MTATATNYYYHSSSSSLSAVIRFKPLRLSGRPPTATRSTISISIRPRPKRSSNKMTTTTTTTPLLLPLTAAAAAAPNQDDDTVEHSENIDVDNDKNKSDQLEKQAKESHEAWTKMLESFVEQATKMQIMSTQAYELYSKRALLILKETSEQLKIQAERTRHELNITAKQIREESKGYLSGVADKSPEEVKDIVEVFVSSTDDLEDVSKLQDFYLGIPYGALLSLGGFLSFMLTGSTSAIRFGVILGGTLFALSISSLRSWKRGESSALALKGQAAIAVIIFSRYLRLLVQRSTFSNCFTTLISGAMVFFYLYRIKLDGGQNGSSSRRGSES